MLTQTTEALQKAAAVKLKVTKTGFEATVKGDTPDAVVALAIRAHTLLTQHKAAGTGISAEQRERAGLPVLILRAPAEDKPGGYVLKHGGGVTGPYDPAVQELLEDYRVKIDLILNTKGIGWDVAVKASSPEEGIALIAYTEDALNQAFAAATV